MNLPPEQPGIVWDDVGFVYPGPQPIVALKPSNMTLSLGEQVALMGPSGSGKSTALNLLGLLDRPTTGSYHLFGCDVTEAAEFERSGLRAEAIGFVFQSFHLLPRRSALENVEIGMLYSSIPSSDRRRLAATALERVGLVHRTLAKCATLSGGERQRVAIARAISHQPMLLLADEPTGNLDQVTGRQILDLLAELMTPSLLQVIVTHDPAVAARCGRTIQIVDGVLRDVP